MTDPNEAHPFAEEFPLLTAIISPKTFDEAYTTHLKDLKNKVARLCNKYQTGSVQYTELYNNHDALLVDDQAHKKEQNTLAKKLSETTVELNTLKAQLQPYLDGDNKPNKLNTQLITAELEKQDL
ncbi:MAG: hypothetical protein FRX48_03098 [Lasallia pustulata]|uniref:Uncharacterized protein n=1 Tax=Lasallia pustulata TaxID=136370 RepID=A0A5M8PUV8_9LECA|nr:MAG: hypothetical protein FRX48_03098 [Lasallia pustulata]